MTGVGDVVALEAVGSILPAVRRMLAAADAQMLHHGAAESHTHGQAQRRGLVLVHTGAVVGALTGFLLLAHADHMQSAVAGPDSHDALPHTGLVAVEGSSGCRAAVVRDHRRWEAAGTKNRAASSVKAHSRELGGTRGYSWQAYDKREVAPETSVAVLHPDTEAFPPVGTKLEAPSRYILPAGSSWSTRSFGPVNWASLSVAVLLNCAVANADRPLQRLGELTDECDCPPNMCETPPITDPASPLEL